MGRSVCRQGVILLGVLATGVVTACGPGVSEESPTTPPGAASKGSVVADREVDRESFVSPSESNTASGDIGIGIERFNLGEAVEWAQPPDSLARLRELTTVVVKARIGAVVFWKEVGEKGARDQVFAWKLSDVEVVSGELVDPHSDVIVPMLMFPPEGELPDQLAELNRGLPSQEGLFFLQTMTIPDLGANPKPGAPPLKTYDDVRLYDSVHPFAVLVADAEKGRISSPLAEGSVYGASGFLAEVAKFDSLEALVQTL